MKYYSTLIMYFTTLLIFICCEEWESAFLLLPYPTKYKEELETQPLFRKKEGCHLSEKKIMRFHVVTSLQKGQKNNVG